MPTIYIKQQHNDQDGYVTGHNTGQKYVNSGSNYGVRTDRLGIVRFTHVAVPKGSTVTSAKLYFATSVKNDEAQSITYRPYVHPTAQSVRLDATAPEWEGRTWDSFGGTNQVFNWQQGGPSRQIITATVTHLVSTMVNHASWTLAGGTLTFALAIAGVTNSDNQYIHRSDDGWPPVLEITYTAPASDGLQTVVNLQENCNFTRETNWDASFSILPYGFNPWFGAFEQPSYAYVTTPAPPFGGKALRVTAGPNAPNRSMIHFGVPRLEEGKWYNASAYVYVPAGSPDVGIAAFGDWMTAGEPDTSVKNQWVRLHGAAIGEAGGLWFAIQQVNGPYAAGSIFYIANVQITEGELLRPYVGGRSIAGATTGWAGPTGYNGFARSTPPTVTLNAIGDKARRKYYAVGWNYSHAQPQQLSELQIRRVK